MSKCWFFLCCLLLQTSAHFALSSAQAQTAADNYLNSPAFGQYNTFVKGTNYLELIAAGSEEVSITIRVYRASGSLKATQSLTLQPQTQQDIDINAIVNDQDTYGVVRIDFEDTNDNQRVIARMSTYRPDSSGDTYSFAYTKDLVNPSIGNTFATANSFDAQGLGYLTPTWAQIVNISSGTQTFTHNIYNQSGTLVESSTFQLNRFQRLDRAAGHQFGEGVFLNEFIPADADTQYFATVVRYGSNSPAGTRSPDYRFAIPLDSRAGATEPQFAPLMNMRETCWEQINWLELVNTSSQAINASVIFRSATGGNIDTSAVLLPARGQFHLNASAVLGSTRELGSAEISATPTGALIAQSSVYYLSCNSSTLFSGFAIQAENKTQAPIVGSFNRFLALENQLITFGVKNGARSVALDLRSNGGAVIHQSSESLNSYRALQLNLNDSTYGTAADTYGLVTLTPSQSESILSFNLRVRKSGTANREIDFVVPTTLR